MKLFSFKADTKIMAETLDDAVLKISRYFISLPLGDQDVNLFIGGEVSVTTIKNSRKEIKDIKAWQKKVDNGNLREHKE